jgi:hypothetical protein
VHGTTTSTATRAAPVATAISTIAVTGTAAAITAEAAAVRLAVMQQRFEAQNHREALARAAAQAATERLEQVRTDEKIAAATARTRATTARASGTMGSGRLYISIHCYVFRFAFMHVLQAVLCEYCPEQC